MIEWLHAVSQSESLLLSIPYLLNIVRNGKKKLCNPVTGWTNQPYVCRSALRPRSHDTQLFTTRRMTIANGTCVSFCNQPKAQFGYLRRVTPVCRCLHPLCGWRQLATSRESKTHFGLPWVPPGDNRGKCYMDGKRIQCLSNASQHIYPSIFNRFPIIQPVSSKVRHFSTFLLILASLGTPLGKSR